MKIINKVTDANYIQWIEKFVADVLKVAKVSYAEVIIEDIQPNKRIYLIIDGKEYIIRTWSFHPVDKVQYTLYVMVTDKDGSHGKEVDFGLIKIQWKN